MQDKDSIRRIHYENAQYPNLLREIDNPPLNLYVRGELKTPPLVAIVGSRRPTSYGTQVTYQLASELAAAGMGVVSGLAIGIDATAHEAALEAGGYTIAVLGCGVDLLYPPRNRHLGSDILSKGGAIISELTAGTPPLRHHFPARNRIIAGLCLAVVVTEADAESGSLITANFARDQNRAVMAIPGSILNQRSAGPNNLLKSGAVPVTSSSDVLDYLNLENVLPTIPAPPASAQEAVILELLDSGVSASNELIKHSQLGAATFARTISLMEISGKVRSLGAGVWVRLRR